MKSPYSPPYPPSSPRTERSGHRAAADHDDYDTWAHGEDYEAYQEHGEGGYSVAADTYDDEPLDRRWIWVAGIAGVVLLVAVVCTSVILGGGDSGSVSATVGTPTTTTDQPSPRATAKAPVATSSPIAPPTALAPETVTTVTPSPSPSRSPTATAESIPESPPAAAAPAPDPRAVTYHVTGSRQLIDLVTVIYTDQQGALQTDLNVALPWTKTIVLDPGVDLSSVTATSVAGQLNCAITDAAGATLAAQNTNTIITTCTK